MVRIFELTQYLEQIAPLELQESYDNSGLLVGNAQNQIKGVLITLDVTENIVNEAISSNCNLIVAHHPLIFKGLKKIISQDDIGRTIIKAIQHDIAIYAIHTNLDNIWEGVNKKIADKLNLINTSILLPLKDNFSKLTFYVPQDQTDEVLAKIHQTGAGTLGNYNACAFRNEGIGQFQPTEDAKPYLGTTDKLEKVKEDRVELVFPSHLRKEVITALKSAHPYEEVAFDTLNIQEPFPYIGAGRIGQLPEPMSGATFIHYIKKKLSLNIVRHTAFPDKPIQKVALCGGSGSFLFPIAKKLQADVYISSDFKYHEFFEADKNIMIADINHFEGEYFTKELIFEFLNKKFTNIALVLSKINTNPISYL